MLFCFLLIVDHKMTLMPYAFCATKCNQRVLGYLPNFVDIVVLITLNVRTKTLFFTSKITAMANRRSVMVKVSKTDNENARGHKLSVRSWICNVCCYNI